MLMGGETTVTVKGEGKGGRNQEFVLAALQTMISQKVLLKDFPVILSAGTDGTDGPTDAAGAVIDFTTIEKMETYSLEPEKFLEQNDSYHFFQQTGSLIFTGPTQTNVMDIVIGLTA